MEYKIYFSHYYVWMCVWYMHISMQIPQYTCSDQRTTFESQVCFSHLYVCSRDPTAAVGLVQQALSCWAISPALLEYIHSYRRQLRFPSFFLSPCTLGRLCHVSVKLPQAWPCINQGLSTSALLTSGNGPFCSGGHSVPFKLSGNFADIFFWMPMVNPTHLTKQVSRYCQCSFGSFAKAPQ